MRKPTLHSLYIVAFTLLMDLYEDEDASVENVFERLQDIVDGLQLLINQ